jgi:hypothetical protein
MKSFNQNLVVRPTRRRRSVLVKKWPDTQLLGWFYLSALRM